VIDADDETNERRIKSMEFAPYYNSELKPQDEFDELFFIDWDHRKFNVFDNLMMSCIKRYLKDKFVDAEPINRETRAFFQKYDEELLYFTENLGRNINLDGIEIFEKYKNHMGSAYHKRMNPRWFYAGLRKISAISDKISEIVLSRSHGRRLIFIIGNIENIPKDPKSGVDGVARVSQEKGTSAPDFPF